MLGQPLKECSKCGGTKDPAGGIEVAGKWLCAKCWAQRASARKNKDSSTKRK
jgi:recombinational DNA repair protein (RecF pathway)